MKPNPNPVYFISLVGVDELGYIYDEHKHIFDLYTKLYDFKGTKVKVKSAQDLWKFYMSKQKHANKEDIDVYKMAEFFIKRHSNGHFVVDECPFRRQSKYNL